MNQLSDLSNEFPYEVSEEQEEQELAEEFLSLQSEEEVDHFLQFLPMAAQAAGAVLPILGQVGRAVLRMAPKVAQGVGAVVQSMAGAGADGGEEELGGIIGNIASSLFGEVDEMADPRLEAARRFVRLARATAKGVSVQVNQIARSGRRPTQQQVRRIVMRTLMRKARSIMPELVPPGERPVDFDGNMPQRAPRAPARPPQAPGRMSGMARWGRQGTTLVIDLPR